LGRADEQHQYVNPEIAPTIIHIDRWSIGTFENITNFLFPSKKKYLFLGTEPNRRSNEKSGLVFPTSKAKL
jgi:hypothetical protein